MSNNNQAKNLPTINNFSLYSEKIEFSKKDLKALKVSSWLEIEQESLSVVVTKDKIAKFKAKLFGDGSYSYLEVTKSCNKKFKIAKDKDSFILKHSFNSSLFIGTVALSKNPLSVVLIYNKKEFAKADLHISDNIYLKIKEIL